MSDEEIKAIFAEAMEKGIGPETTTLEEVEELWISELSVR